MRLRPNKSAKLLIEGRSLPVNIGLILLNILGLVFLAMGYHPAHESTQWLIPTGYIVFIGSFAGLFALKGLYLMSYVARAFVGGLFIVSGLVKANDPKGFAYKLEEYFEDGALAYRVRDLLGWDSFTLEGFIEYALILSVIICVVEIVLGIMVILGARIKLAAWLLLGMMLFFTALTWHTKECNPADTFTKKMEFATDSPQAIDYIAKAETREDLTILSNKNGKVVVAETRTVQCVTDCGCFGDALKGSVGRSLTPQESFWKDIVVGYFVLIIFIMQFSLLKNTKRDSIVLSVTAMAVVVFFSWVFGWYFPILFAFITLLGSMWIRRSGGKYLGNDWGAILFSTVITVILVIYVLLYLPLKDYRPYAVGSNLIEKMNDGIDGVVENTFDYKNVTTGEIKKMTNEEYMTSKIWEDQNWAFDTMTANVIVEPLLPSITEQFGPTLDVSQLSEYDKQLPVIAELLKDSYIKAVVMTSDVYGISDTIPETEFFAEEYDSTFVQSSAVVIDPELGEVKVIDLILNAPSIFILSVEDIKNADWSSLNEIKKIAEKAKENNIPFIMICGSVKSEIDEFRKTNAFDVAAFTNDRIELKAVCRSNPGLLLIQNAVVKAKYPHRGLPSFETIKKNYLK